MTLFSVNGYNFEKRTDNNNTDYIYLQAPATQATLIGIVSGTTIYFDNRMLDQLGDFSLALWHDTLNYAFSDDININKNYEDRRNELQVVLNEMNAVRTRSILESIHFTTYDYDSDDEDFYEDEPIVY